MYRLTFTASEVTYVVLSNIVYNIRLLCDSLRQTFVFFSNQSIRNIYSKLSAELDIIKYIQSDDLNKRGKIKELSKWRERVFLNAHKYFFTIYPLVSFRTYPWIFHGTHRLQSLIIPRCLFNFAFRKSKPTSNSKGATLSQQIII